MIATFVRLCVAIVLVMGVAFGLHRSGLLLEAKHTVDPNSPRNAVAWSLWTTRNVDAPLVIGDAWFHKVMRRHCQFDRANYVVVEPTTFRSLSRLVGVLPDDLNAPVILQLTNQTWFPNRSVAEFDFDLYPERSGSILAGAWNSTQVMFAFLPDILRYDRSGRKPRKGSLVFASANLLGLAELQGAIDAQGRRVFLVSADENKPVDVTKRQLARRADAIEGDGTERIQRGISTFANETGCGVEAKSAYRETSGTDFDLARPELGYGHAPRNQDVTAGPV